MFAATTAVLQNHVKNGLSKIRVNFKQCCGAGAGGAEIILGPGAGAENKF